MTEQPPPTTDIPIHLRTVTHFNYQPDPSDESTVRRKFRIGSYYFDENQYVFSCCLWPFIFLFAEAAFYGLTRTLSGNPASHPVVFDWSVILILTPFAALLTARDFVPNPSPHFVYEEELFYRDHCPSRCVIRCAVRMEWDDIWIYPCMGPFRERDNLPYHLRDFLGGADNAIESLLFRITYTPSKDELLAILQPLLSEGVDSPIIDQFTFDIVEIIGPPNIPIEDEPPPPPPKEPENPYRFERHILL